MSFSAASCFLNVCAMVLADLVFLGLAWGDNRHRWGVDMGGWWQDGGQGGGLAAQLRLKPRIRARGVATHGSGAATGAR